MACKAGMKSINIFECGAFVRQRAYPDIHNKGGPGASHENSAGGQSLRNIVHRACCHEDSMPEAGKVYESSCNEVTLLGHFRSPFQRTSYHLFVETN